MSYLSGLFGMKVMKEYRDFKDMIFSSTVTEKSQVCLDLHMAVKVANTSRIGANLSAQAPLLILFGLSSKRRYFNSLVNLFLGIVSPKI